MDLRTLLVIPARYASQRFPGKPLVGLKGASGQIKPLIQRSWEAASLVSGPDSVVIATDDDRIRAAAERFGAEVVMTPSSCRNGTERCAAAHAELGGGFELVINLQGDAPLTPKWFVEPLISFLKVNRTAAMATPVLQCSGSTLAELRRDRSEGRVGGTTAVLAQDGRAVYFSKEVLPFTTLPFEAWDMTPVWHHVGVYAYTAGALAQYPEWPVSELEMLEGLEQLRFLDQGKDVFCVPVEARGRPFWELNNPEDVPKVEAMLTESGII